MNGTIATCRKCKRQLEDDGAACTTCGPGVSAGATARRQTTETGAANARIRPIAGSQRPSNSNDGCDAAPSSRRMVTDAEIRSKSARLSPLWLALGLSGHVFGFTWAAFGPPMASMTPISHDARIAGSSPLSEDEAISLRERLRSNEPSRRGRAEARLRDAGAAVDYDRHVNIRASNAADAAEVLECWVEIRGDQLVGSVRTFIGDNFSRGMTPGEGEVAGTATPQTRIAVRGKSLAEPVRIAINTAPGDTLMDGHLLATGLAPGRYEVEVVLVAARMTSTGESTSIETPAVTLAVDYAEPGVGSAPRLAAATAAQ